jgi:hypothetical protein
MSTAHQVLLIFARLAWLVAWLSCLSCRIWCSINIIIRCLCIIRLTFFWAIQQSLVLKVLAFLLVADSRYKAVIFTLVYDEDRKAALPDRGAEADLLHS